MKNLNGHAVLPVGLWMLAASTVAQGQICPTSFLQSTSANLSSSVSWRVETDGTFGPVSGEMRMEAVATGGTSVPSDCPRCPQQGQEVDGFDIWQTWGGSVPVQIAVNEMSTICDRGYSASFNAGSGQTGSSQDSGYLSASAGYYQDIVFAENESGQLVSWSNSRAGGVCASVVLEYQFNWTGANDDEVRFSLVPNQSGQGSWADNTLSGGSTVLTNTGCPGEQLPSASVDFDADDMTGLFYVMLYPTYGTEPGDPFRIWATVDANSGVVLFGGTVPEVFDDLSETRDCSTSQYGEQEHEQVGSAFFDGTTIVFPNYLTRLRVDIKVVVDSKFIDPQDLCSVEGVFCLADVDGSGGVDMDDLAMFVRWFQTGDPRADIDGSGGVDFLDWEAFFKAWETGC